VNWLSSFVIPLKRDRAADQTRTGMVIYHAFLLYDACHVWKILYVKIACGRNDPYAGAGCLPE
jgi:hypothetical protein